MWLIDIFKKYFKTSSDDVTQKENNNVPVDESVMSFWSNQLYDFFIDYNSIEIINLVGSIIVQKTDLPCEKICTITPYSKRKVHLLMENELTYPNMPLKAECNFSCGKKKMLYILKYYCEFYGIH